MVEVALALALEPRILLLDEPAAGLSGAEREALLALLFKLPESLAVLIIEHDMSLVFRLARKITVLVEGGILVEGTVDEVRNDPRVRNVYLQLCIHGHDGVTAFCQCTYQRMARAKALRSRASLVALV